MATFATPADLASFMQQDVDTASATLVLGLVEDEMAHTAGVAAASLPSWVRLTGLTVSARVYANPVGLTSDALDDYRRNFGGSLLSGDERDRIREVAGSSAAFTITPYGPSYTAQAGWSLPPDWDVNP